jgi:hypothetical protein
VRRSPLSERLWYHFSMSGESAARQLQGCGVGAYLVRASVTTSHTWVLSALLLVNGTVDVAHCRLVIVERDGERRVHTEGNTIVFRTIAELVAGTSVLLQPVERSRVSNDHIQCAVRVGAKLGQGSAGVVYQAELEGTVVAIKQLSGDAATPQQIIAEMDTMLRIPPHANVVALIGVVLTPMALVMEFAGQCMCVRVC